eukprot:scaffold277450_cov33-Prasinocladus_malaysianus.AAC.1
MLYTDKSKHRHFDHMWHDMLRFRQSIRPAGAGAIRPAVSDTAGLLALFLLQFRCAPCRNESF